jgi:hypothetical protein
MYMWIEMNMDTYMNVGWNRYQWMNDRKKWMNCIPKIKKGHDIAYEMKKEIYECLKQNFY